MNTENRVSPQAPEIEEAIIGACLIEQGAIPLVADKLRPEMFYVLHHQVIYAAILAMYHAGIKIDILTVKEELSHRGKLEEAGGPFGITQLSSKVATSAHLEYHAQIVHEKYLRREMILGFNKLLACSLDETMDIDDSLVDAHNLLDRLEGEFGHRQQQKRSNRPPYRTGGSGPHDVRTTERRVGGGRRPSRRRKNGIRTTHGTKRSNGRVCRSCLQPRDARGTTSRPMADSGQRNQRPPLAIGNRQPTGTRRGTHNSR